MPTTPKTSEGIIAKLGEIMAELNPIGKDARNKEQNYNYRAAEDIYNVLHPLCASRGVICLPECSEAGSHERPTKSGGVLRFVTVKLSLTFLDTEDGSRLMLGPVLGEGMDSGDKATNKAITSAMKNAVTHAFVLATKELTDSETDNPEPGDQPPAKPTRPGNDFFGKQEGSEF